MPTNLETDHMSNLSIDVENSIAMLPNCTHVHRALLISCGKMGSCCMLNLGLADGAESDSDEFSVSYTLFQHYQTDIRQGLV